MSSSFLISASPWTSSSSTTKKRTSTMNLKKTSRRNSTIEIDDDDSSSISENFESAIEEQDNRNSRVNQMLNKITDAGDGLADFVPVAAPKGPTNRNNTLADLLPVSEGFESTLLQRAAGIGNNEYSPNNSGEETLSNYMKIYEPGTSGLLGKPYYASMGIAPNSTNDNNVMQKLNYITHILEDIQMEKTSNITEELILYSFLGVFVIFVVDSFAKAGKYYR